MQCSHSALEFAYQFGRPSDHHPTLVCLTIQDKSSLEDLRATLNSHGIVTSEFVESYNNWGLTAISCQLKEDQRHLLSHLSLWTPK